MNQDFGQTLSTVQQIKLRQLELEVKSLEMQLASTLGVEQKPDLGRAAQLSNSFIYLDETMANTVIKLTQDAR